MHVRKCGNNKLNFTRSAKKKEIGNANKPAEALSPLSSAALVQLDKQWFSLMRDAWRYLFHPNNGVCQHQGVAFLMHCLNAHSRPHCPATLPCLPIFQIQA
jgi:hypothetical protein